MRWPHCVRKKKEALTNFKLREQTIQKEIHRLAMDVRTGQSSLYAKVNEA